jgi:hypothetical protein
MIESLLVGVSLSSVKEAPGVVGSAVPFGSSAGRIVRMEDEDVGISSVVVET